MGDVRLETWKFDALGITDEDDGDGITGPTIAGLPRPTNASTEETVESRK